MKEEAEILKAETQRLMETMSGMEKVERLRLEIERLPTASLSFEKFVNEEKIPLKSYTGFDTPNQLEAFYNLVNYNGQCERLKIWGTKWKSER